MKVHNFSAGPGILPAEVIEKAAAAVHSFQKVGLSILEISHRTKEYEAVVEEAELLVKKLLYLGDDYKIIFLQGGASLQFAMLPYNFLNTKAAYMNTGTWASKAIEEAKLFGEVEVVASSQSSNFNYIPKNYTIPSDADYFHVTSNNTIYGTQIKNLDIDSPVALVADMSSDIFSRCFDATQYDLIYAGAQKNMGPAGVTMVIVKNTFLSKIKKTIPSMLDYRTHAKNDSMYNTPPVYALYVAMLTLRWIDDNGGIESMEKRNTAKANLLYTEVDRNSLFEGTVAVEDRSAMNANFVLKNKELESIFDTYWQAANIYGLKGHRSVGGYRASMYNALPIDSVEVLVATMQVFEQAILSL